MDFVSSRIRNLVPYKAGEQVQYILKLNTNENPYPPTPRINQLLRDIDINQLKLYPDQNNTMLINAIAQKFEVSKDMVFVGNGSDEILALMHPAFFDGANEKIAYPDVTYSFYPVYADLFEIGAITPLLKDDFTIDINDYKGLDVKGFIFANPNAPTSISLPKAVLEQFIKTNPDKLVIVDEAYIDFCSESVVHLTKIYDNLLVIQTFSKGYALAGIRCGFAIGNKSLIEGLKIIKDSFNNYPVDYITERIATMAIEDKEYYQDINSKVIATRERVILRMREMGFSVLQSSSNFIFASHPDHSANDLYSRLKAQQILVRQWNKKRIDNHLRITIGTDVEMDLFLTKLQELINA